MTIKFYPPGHGSGFAGFRVTGTYAGKERHAEFPIYPSTKKSDPLVRYQELQAQLKQAEWESEDALFRYQVFVSESDPRSGPYEGTGVHGIFCYFFHSKLGGWQAGFKVKATRPGRSPRFLFATKPFSKAWRDAVGFWAAEHGIEQDDVQRVLSRPPEPAQFKDLRRYLNDHKKADIPVETLTPVFAEQREAIAQKKALEKAKNMNLSEGIPTQTTEHVEADMMAWFESGRG